MAAQEQRPQFLTVICILSFIGLGWSMLSAIINMALAPMIKEIGGLAEMGMDEAMSEVSTEAPEIAPLLQKIFGGSMAALEHLFELALISFICSAIALFGVIQMWKLKKVGFYFYTGAKLIVIISPMILIGGIIGSITLIGAMVPIAFIVMYAVNLKAME